MAGFSRQFPREVFSLSPSPMPAQERRISARRELPSFLGYSETPRSQPPRSLSPSGLPPPSRSPQRLPSFLGHTDRPRSPPPSGELRPLPSYHQLLQTAMENARPRPCDASGGTTSAAAAFIENHTTLDHSVPLLDECPICLDPYDLENCLRITGISGCEHYVGQTCLENMLSTQPLQEKKCPLCRAVWIPAPTRPHRHFTQVYHGIDGIGPDMRGNAPPERLDRPLPPRPSMSPAYGDPNLSDPHPHPSGEVIFIDSDSEDDYETQVQNFEEFNRDIADIRNRARNTQLSRRRRRRQRSASANSSANAATNPGRNSGNSNENTGNRANARAGGFNRFLNRNLNPFKPVANAHPLSLDDGVTRRSSLHTRRERRSPLQEARSRRASPRSSHTLSPTPEVRRRRNLSLGLEDIDMDVAQVHVEEIPAVESQAARESLRVRQLDQSEQELSRREAALTAREADLARREDELVEKTRRAQEMGEAMRRHREARKELERTQSEELDRIIRGLGSSVRGGGEAYGGLGIEGYDG